MKVRHYRRQLLAIAVTVLLPLSCSRADRVSEGVFFTVSSEDTVSDAVKSNVSDYTDKPSPEEFVLTLKNSSSETVWTGKLSEWSADMPLPVGDYIVTAVYGKAGEEGFDLPYYTGKANFSINGGESVNVNIPAKLANCMVKFSLTDSFKNYYPKSEFSIKTGAGKVIPFPREETRAAFVDATKIIVSGNLVNQGNASSTYGPKTYEPLSGATCYTVKFDVTNVGGVKLTVSFDKSIDVVDLGTIEINE